MEKVAIGIIGCGTISEVYMTNIREHFPNLDLRAVADLYVDKAKASAERFGVPVGCTPDELLAMPEIQIVLNLTIPAVHYKINRQILEAGKHAYCEKPLAVGTEEARELVALAKEKGLLCLSAPDTFLGAGIQECRYLLDSGRIGRPVGFTANLYSPGHELWHPNPGFYYQKGGGPLFDMGPYYLTALIYLLGPIKRLACFNTVGRAERNILGTMKTTEVPTTYTGILEFACGAVGTVYMSLDTWDSSLPLLEIYGTEGTIYASDPNFFQGSVRLFEGWRLQEAVDCIQAPHPAKLISYVVNQKKLSREVDISFPHSMDEHLNFRGLGVSDMAQAILNRRAPRLNGEVALHVVEAMNAMDDSAKYGRFYEMQTTCPRTEPMERSWKLWEVQ